MSALSVSSYALPTPRTRPGKMRRILQDLGVSGRRNMYWWADNPMNFGDWIGPLLFAWRTGRAPRHYVNSKRKRRGRCLYTVGSILHEIRRPGAAVIWGSGMLDAGTELARPRATHAVRGPLTHRRLEELGYPCAEVYGDPAILLPRALPMAADPDAGVIGIVPHFSPAEIAGRMFGGRDGFQVIDVRRPVAEVVRDMLGCVGIVSSSLHGLIVAHAYGLPALWAEFRGGGEVASTGGTFKFRDYFLGVGLAPVPEVAPLTGRESPADLLRLTKDAPAPDLTGRADRLLETCPF